MSDSQSFFVIENENSSAPMYIHEERGGSRSELVPTVAVEKAARFETRTTALEFCKWFNLGPEWIITARGDDAVYTVDYLGVIHQQNPNVPPKDGTFYTDYYNALGFRSRAAASLRLGYMLAVTQIGSTPRREAQEKEQYITPTILDVGYGNGDFLRACADAGLVARGYDKYPIDLGDARVATSTAQYFLTGQEYDCVTFFDALEHFESLDFVRELRTRFVVVSVPCCHWDPWTPEFRDWKHRKPNEHLHHFDLNSLKAFMSHSGYSFLHECNIEDAIRGTRQDGLYNILTAAFKKYGT